MKISNDLPAPELDPQQGNKVEDVQKTGRTQPAGSDRPGGGDSVSISQRGQELSRLASRAEDAPVAGNERLDAIQAAVAEGRYSLSPQSVARGLLDSLTNDPSGI